MFKNRKPKRIKSQFMLLMTLLSIIITGLFSVFNYYSQRNVLMNILDEELKSSALLGTYLNSFIMNSIIFCLIVIAISLILSYFLADFIAVPINRITGIIQDLAAGKAGLLAQEKGSYELSILTESFNQLTQILHDKISQLAEKEEKMRITLHSIAEGVITTDVSGKITQMNTVAEQITGWKNHEAEGKPLDEVFCIYNDNNGAGGKKSSFHVLERGKIVITEKTALIRSRNGIRRSIYSSAAPIKDVSGDILGTVIVFRDITDENKKKDEITYLSYHDSLTGLYNRAFFEAEVKRLDIERQLPLSVIIGDVNGLKITNDVFGHQKGDLLLKKTAAIMKEACRADEIIARWGGDEFVILLPKTDEKTAAEICERFRKSCEENGLLNNDNKDNLPALSISFGYATKKRTDEKISDILKKAEDFMYGLKLLESRSFHISVVSSIKDTLYEKSNEPQEHTERLADFCVRTGYAMGLSETAIKDLELFCLLHDIGKIGVTESILKKEGPLDAEEWKEVKRHSELGYRIANSVPELSHIAEYILTHHERWDGNGYPRGIKKESIPLLSRILAVADAYDTMTHDKPYRKALAENEAVEELLKNTQTQFDINVVDTFINDVLGYGDNFNRLEASNCF